MKKEHHATLIPHGQDRCAQTGTDAEKGYWGHWRKEEPSYKRKLKDLGSYSPQNEGWKKGDALRSVNTKEWWTPEREKSFSMLLDNVGMGTKWIVKTAGYSDSKQRGKILGQPLNRSNGAKKRKKTTLLKRQSLINKLKESSRGTALLWSFTGPTA